MNRRSFFRRVAQAVVGVVTAPIVGKVVEPDLRDRVAVGHRVVKISAHGWEHLDAFIARKAAEAHGRWLDMKILGLHAEDEG